MPTNQKQEEGFEKIKLAEKSLKTSFLKWRPDYEVAADEFSQAAICFKNSKTFDKSKECLLRASDCYKQNNAFFHAAKCLDQAILLAKDLNDYKDVAELAARACNYYQQHGSTDAGAASLDRAGRILEQVEPEQALRLFQKAADILYHEENYKQAAASLNKSARILVKLQMYDQAAIEIKKEIGLHQHTDYYPAIGRLAVALVLVQLARGDFVAAEKAFKEWGNCCEPPECQNLEMLIQGYDEEDPGVVRRALNHPFIKHMDVEYARLAKVIPLPEAICIPKATVREDAAQTYVSTNTRPAPPGLEEPEDTKEEARAAPGDEDEGLC